MNFRKIIIGGLVMLFMIISSVACSSAKEVEERKNYMIPKKSEMVRNSRYKEAEKRKLNKHKSQNRKKKSLF
jgi:hypothetical protein